MELYKFLFTFYVILFLLKLLLRKLCFKVRKHFTIFCAIFGWKSWQLYSIGGDQMRLGCNKKIKFGVHDSVWNNSMALEQLNKCRLTFLWLNCVTWSQWLFFFLNQAHLAPKRISGSMSFKNYSTIQCSQTKLENSLLKTYNLETTQCWQYNNLIIPLYVMANKSV